MIFNPQNLIKTESIFTFFGDVKAIAHPSLNKDIIKELWRGFTYQSSDLSISETDELIFSIGSTKPLALDGYDYSINIEQDGICVYAENEKDLMRGFMTLLDRFKAVERDESLAIYADCSQIKDKPQIRTRMVHFCIFPETELWEIQRFIRFCAALKYTHVILEFWGMLKYDCLAELSWSHAYTKEQIKPIIKEANDLGIEIVPMFNHWGHASASRVMHGKHVVLDQNPQLQTYFSEDGWCWDISKEKVRDLLRSIRRELCELCGKGEYFHIGCDEAYAFDFTEENMDNICGFINEISDEMKAEGRRVIIWGDMFLYRYAHYEPKNRYDCNAPSPEVAEALLNRLSRDVIIADWQYEAPVYPIETSAVFANAGFDTLVCPWDRGDAHMRAVISTVKESGLMGVLHTTWHTLRGGFPYVAMAAKGGYEDVTNCSRALMRTPTAALLRKVLPCGGDYEKSGWARLQLENV